MNYYNEIDPYCCSWLLNLMSEGLIPDGYIDSRSITDVTPGDLSAFTQCHFFAGIAGWSLALRLAGWPEDREIWTGSCPCQPFSVAGRRAGTGDARHLWPDFYRLIRAVRPTVVMGEQVAGSAGYGWFDGVLVDLEAEAYTGRAVDIPACSVNAPQIRSRLYWMACTTGARSWTGFREENSVEDRNGPSGGRRRVGAIGSVEGSNLAFLRQEPPAGEQSEPERQHGFHQGSDACGLGGTGSPERWPDAEGRLDVDERADTGRQEAASGSELAGPRGFWDDWQLIGPDPEGKYRRIKPGITPLDTRLPGDVGQIRGYGNAICPPLAAEVIRAYMDVC